MSNWVENFQKELFDLGYYGNISQGEAVSGTDGPLTREAFAKAKKDGYRWDGSHLIGGISQQNQGNIETDEKPEENSENSEIQYKKFIPSILKGRCNTPECALFVNNELEAYSGNHPYGNAWNNFQNTDYSSIVSGYSNMANNYLARSAERNRQAARIWKENVDTNALNRNIPYLVNMYYQNSQGVPSPNTATAYNEGITINGAGKITGTHTGLLWDDNGTWRVTDNVHGNVSTEPLSAYFHPGRRSKLITASGAYSHPVRRIPQERFNPDLNIYPSVPRSGRENRLFPYFNNYASKEELLNYINNRNPEEGVDLSMFGLNRTGDLKTYSNIASPIIATSMLGALANIHTISQKYDIPTYITNEFIPLVTGILWKESNGGSNQKVNPKNGKYEDNTQYRRNHLSTGMFNLRMLGSLFRNPSTTIGSDKLNHSLTFGKALVSTPAFFGMDKQKIYDVQFGGANVMANMASNFIKLQKLLGDDAYLLYNEDGNQLSNLGKGLLLEAHNQGLDSGIKNSINAYKKDGNLDHLKQFYDESIRLVPKEDQPSYGRTIFQNLNEGFTFNNKYNLGEVEVYGNKNK